MQFASRPRVPSLGKPKSPAPLPVGCHAFVKRAPSLMQKLGGVPLTEERDARTLRVLADGQEVEILGWRQRPSVCYNVRCVSGGAESWVGAECLRASRNPLPDTSLREVSREGSMQMRRNGGCRQVSSANGARVVCEHTDPSRG